ncbi:hypothetical protein IM40_02580 [Candidatus Paracaedimonas acanthamoebae]|nr:hypothetical protein IM40_02580 [Candidatus Paracaedimonas acanthamoebae]
MISLIRGKNIALITLLAAIERFVFNGLRSMVVLFLVKELLYSNQNAFATYGSLMMLSYLTPLVGGWISDKYLGQENSIFIGFLCSAIGSLLLYLDFTYFFLGASFALVGRGLVRPSILPLLSQIIGKDSLNRDAQFTFFYALMNLATLFGTVMCAVLGECLNWKVSFLMMLIADCLALFFLGFFGKYIKLSIAKLGQDLLKLLSVPIIIAIVYFFFNYATIQPTFIISFILISGILVALATLFHAENQTKNIKVFGLVILITVSFFILYEQSGNSLVLFAENYLDRTLKGFSNIGITTIPTTFFQAIDPLFNLMLGFILALLWRYLKKYKISYSIFTKMSAGLGMVSIGFLVLWISTRLATQGLVSPWFLILALMCFVIGEICIMPTAMSAITKIAPKKYASFYVGIWYFSIGIAQYFSGKLATLTSQGDTAGIENLGFYTNFFNSLCLISLGAAVTFFFIPLWLRIKL